MGLQHVGVAVVLKQVQEPEERVVSEGTSEALTFLAH